MSSIVALAGRSTILPRLRRKVFTVASSPGMPATTMSPLSASACWRDDDVVAVEDAGVDHRVAADPQHEQLAVAGEVLGDAGSISSTFSAASTPVPAATSPSERDVADRPALDRRAGGRLERDLDRAGLARVAAEVALVLERARGARAPWSGDERPTASPISRTLGG